MVITKSEEVTKQGSSKILGRKLPLGEVKSLSSTYSIFGGWGGGGRLFEFEWE